MGYLYISLSAFFFCLMTVFVKIAGQELETIQIVFVRGVITLFFTFVIIKTKNVYLWGKNHKLLVLRGITGTIALFFVYESIQRFPLPEATVIQYLYPIFTALLASFIISEHVGMKLYLAIIVGLVGVYTILGFPFINPESFLEPVNLVIAIIGAFLTGLAYVLVRMASNKEESPYVVMFYFPLFTVPLSFPFAYESWISPSIDIWIILILVGISTQLGQTFLTFGYKLLPASRAATTSYIQVPFSALAGAVIFHENISYNFIAGSIVIFFAIFLIIKNRKQTEYNILN
ncbi:MAG: EamA family transporter [Candidatus Marinimicrobia bacterium]|nr:EamA family transporter [Candidatus Neomarinimicrobiota bacterium]|tara:strand:- start:1139 stop:2005 length:867 start_codon:yes stop_codon:yes gene_type:complete